MPSSPSPRYAFLCYRMPALCRMIYATRFSHSYYVIITYAYHLSLWKLYILYPYSHYYSVSSTRIVA